MIINDISPKSKAEHFKDLFIPLLIVFIGLAGFGGFKLHALEASRSMVELDTSHLELRSTSIPSAVPAADGKSTTTPVITGKYVASRGGTTYHLLSCPGAKRISEKNKIYFETKEEAARFGYKPAKNCKAIEK